MHRASLASRAYAHYNPQRNCLRADRWRDCEALTPGRDPGGCIITILLGIAGAFCWNFVGKLIWGENYIAGWIMSILGAMLLLLIYRMITGKRRRLTPTLTTQSPSLLDRHAFARGSAACRHRDRERRRE